jgi:hypothetical protein
MCIIHGLLLFLEVKSFLVLFFCFYFFLGLMIELTASQLQSKFASAFATVPVYFALVTFGDGVSSIIYMAGIETPPS